MRDADLRGLLKGAHAPDEDGAAARALAVARRAYAEREPVPRSRRVPVRALAALAAIGVVAGIAVSPAGSWIRDAIGRERVVGVETARPAPTSLPAPGRLLVVSRAGAWVVRADGSRRLLGVYRGASWSPRGLFAVAWRGRELAALEPGRTEAVRWSLTRGPIADARWAPSGFRVAYRSGPALRVVAGDGTGDRRLASRVAPVAPAWRPGARNVLAYAAADGRVVVQDADSREILWRTPPLAQVVALAWGRGGRLVVASSEAIRTFRDGRERRERRIEIAGGRVAALAVAPGGEVAYAVASRSTGESRVLAVRAPGVAPRLLFAGQGRFTSLVPSPDGEYLLVGWPAADQWLFVPTAPGKRLVAAANVARLFAPDQARPASFPRVEGWAAAG